MPFSTQLIVDFDFVEYGWEVSIRFDAESCEGSWSGLSDLELTTLVGSALAQAAISERDEKLKK